MPTSLTKKQPSGVEIARLPAPRGWAPGGPMSAAAVGVHPVASGSSNQTAQEATAMPASPAPLPRRTRSDGISRAQLRDPVLVELVDDRHEFEGLLNDWLYAGENDCAERTS